MLSRDEYVLKLKGQLDRWNADLAAWEARARAAQADAKQRFDEQLVLLHDQREKVLYNLKLLENASAAAWQDFSRGADQAWVAMGQAVDKARAHFEKK
ncbi:MAG TPA: hypothetical protein VFJ62_11625 [Usitatibacter sp.]|nr:hypothetical protein [Usitatibacter sp.]